MVSYKVKKSFISFMLDIETHEVAEHQIKAVLNNFTKNLLLLNHYLTLTSCNFS